MRTLTFSCSRTGKGQSISPKLAGACGARPGNCAVAAALLATCLLAWSLLACPSRAGAAAADLKPPGGEAAPPETGGVGAYVEGLDLLGGGDYAGAIKAFAAALQADEDNADYVRSRGVANALTENFPAALADLQRAMRLNARDGDARLWLAATYSMSGDGRKGAENYAVGRDIPPGYAEIVYLKMARESFQFRRPRDPDVLPSADPRKPPDKALYLAAAKAYVARHQAGGEAAAGVLKGRARRKLAKGDWVGASNDLSTLARSQPEDPTVLGERAICRLEMGDAATARVYFTKALSVNPLWADGYLGRADAAVSLADPARASADLETAAALGARPADADLARVAALRKQHPAPGAPPGVPDGAPDEAAAKFAKAVQSDVSFDALVEAATDLRRWAEARRSPYDEQYQDRLTALLLAARADERNADLLETTGRFLLESRFVPVIWDGPRGDGTQLRPQSKDAQARELNVAGQLADRALQLDARNANALATRGVYLYATGDRAAAAALADRGLALAPQGSPEPPNARVIRLKVQLLDDKVSEVEGRINALLAGRTEISTVNNPDGSSTTTTEHFPPTDQQRAAAGGLAALKEELRAQIKALLEQADRVNRVIVPALLKQAKDALTAGDVGGARKVLERAYALQPEAPELYPLLADACRRQGDVAGAKAFALLAKSMDTVAAEEAEALKAAWEAINRTAWKAAGAALDRAEALGPADARIPAYRAVMAARRDAAAPSAPGQGGDVMAARRWCRAALALDEARFRRMGSGFLRGAPGSPPPPDSRDAALTLALRLYAGNLCRATGDYDAAINGLAENLAIEGRFSGVMTDLAPAAMLPEPQAEDGTLPGAPTYASLFAWSHVALGRALASAGRTEDARKQLQAVGYYRSHWPMTADNRQTVEVPFEAAQRALQDLDKPNAQEMSRIDEIHRNIAALERQRDEMERSMRSRRLTVPEYERARKEIEEVRRKIDQQNQALTAVERGRPSGWEKTPSARIEKLKGLISAEQRQQDQLRPWLGRGNLRDVDRQRFQESLGQSQERIDQYKKELDALQSGTPGGSGAPAPR